MPMSALTGSRLRERRVALALRQADLAESVGTLDHIMNRFKNEVKRFQSGEDLDQDLYEALFDYYMDSGEMPYGVAKARSGDPYEWVTQRFDDEIGVTESSYPSQEELDDHHEESLGRRNDSIHAEAADNEPSRARQHYTPDVPKTDTPKKTSWLRDPIAAATDRIYDKIKGVKEDSELNELARLAGIKTTNESASVISGDYDGDGDHDMHDHEVESEDRGTMSVSTNQSSTGTTFNLRGLGENSTLSMVDGLRAIDTSVTAMIPDIAIARVEIVLGEIGEALRRTNDSPLVPVRHAHERRAGRRGREQEDEELEERLVAGGSA